MISSIALLLGVAFGLIVGTASMGIGVAVNRQECLDRAANAQVAGADAEWICKVRGARGPAPTTPGLRNGTKRRAARRLLRRGRV